MLWNAAHILSCSNWPSTDSPPVSLYELSAEEIDAPIVLIMEQGTSVHRSAGRLGDRDDFVFVSCLTASSRNTVPPPYLRDAKW